MTAPFGRRRLVAGVVCCVALIACAPTTVDTVETAPAGPPPSATAPSGTPEQLLGRLHQEVRLLSERVVENEGQREALGRIEALWEVVRPEIEADRPDLLPDFAAAMELTRRSVERRRPADADKAANNLRVLIATFTG